MDELIERLRYEADISDRPGQMDRLNALADEFAAALEAAQERFLRRAESLIAAGKGLPFKPSFGMLVIEWLREIQKGSEQ